MLVDLHRHIEGSITPYVAERIGEPLSCRWNGSADFFGFWAPVIEYMRSPARYAEVVANSLRELASIGVTYVELQYSPAETSVDPVETAVVIQKALAVASGRYGIEGNLIYTITRHLPQTIPRDCAHALELFHRGVICGVGLAGDEAGYPVRSLAGLLGPILEARIPKTFHAGEFTGPQEIADAIALGANRIGHANHLIEDTDVLKAVRDRKIGIEVCITSELSLNNVTSWPAHPIRIFNEEGLLFNVNTDDPAVFGTDIDREYAIAAEVIPAETLSRNALEMSFLPPEKKKGLLRQVGHRPEIGSSLY